MPKVHVEATLTLNERELKILAHVFSYALAKKVWNDMTREYSEKELDEVFSSMRDELGKVITAAEEAAKRVF